VESEFVERLKDYFDPCELVELLDKDITVEDIVYAFPDVFEQNKDVLEEFMTHGR